MKIVSHFSLLTILIYFSASLVWAHEDKESTQNEIATKAEWPKPVNDTEQYGIMLFDVLEYRGGNEPTLNWDLIGWRGDDIQRIWIKSEGNKQVSSSRRSEVDLQVLYGKLITSFFDLQAGLRFKQKSTEAESPSQFSAVVGVQGLALYMYELDAALFLSQAGDLAARVTATEDFLFSQKVISQIRLESNASSRRVEKFEVGSGLNDLSIGIRLRYEIRRELAPYVGASWANRYGESADLARYAGSSTSETSLVAGLRIWY